MARTPGIFKQTDLVRAIKAAEAAGKSVISTEITRDGTIRLMHINDDAPAETPIDAFDAWRAKRDARRA